MTATPNTSRSRPGRAGNGWAPMLLIQAEVHDPHHTGKVPHELAELHRRGFVDEREGAIMYPPDLGYVGFRRADGLFVHIDQSDDGEKIACRLGDDTRLFLSHGGNRKGLLYRVTPAASTPWTPTNSRIGLGGTDQPAQGTVQRNSG